MTTRNALFIRRRRREEADRVSVEPIAGGAWRIVAGWIQAGDPIPDHAEALGRARRLFEGSNQS